MTAPASSSSKLTDLVTDLAVKLEKACDPAKMVRACDRVEWWRRSLAQSMDRADWN